MCWLKNYSRDFPGDPVVKNLPSNAGDASSIPGWGTKNPHVMWYRQKKKKRILSIGFLSFFFFLNIFLVVLGPRRYAQGFSS